MGKISEIFNFENIGGKIKNFAKWSCWITILLIWIAAPIIFIVFISDRWLAELCWIPLLSAIVGPVLVWLESWLLYAFGELVDKACDIERNTRGGERKSVAQTKVDAERLNKIEKLRSQGLITEEEYQQAISKEN